MTLWTKLGLWEAVQERVKKPESYSKTEALGAYALMFDFLSEAKGMAVEFDVDEYSSAMEEMYADPMNGGGTILLKVSDLSVCSNEQTEQGEHNYPLLRGYVDVGSCIDWTQDPSSDFRDAIDPTSEIEIKVWGEESISATLVTADDGKTVRRFQVYLNEDNFCCVLNAVHRRQAFLTKEKAFSSPDIRYVDDWVEILGYGLVRPDLKAGPSQTLSLTVDRVRRVEDPGPGLNLVLQDIWRGERHWDY